MSSINTNTLAGWQAWVGAGNTVPQGGQQATGGLIPGGQSLGYDAFNSQQGFGYNPWQQYNPWIQQDPQMYAMSSMLSMMQLFLMEFLQGKNPTPVEPEPKPPTIESGIDVAHSKELIAKADKAGNGDGRTTREELDKLVKTNEDFLKVARLTPEGLASVRADIDVTKSLIDNFSDIAGVDVIRNGIVIDTVDAGSIDAAELDLVDAKINKNGIITDQELDIAAKGPDTQPPEPVKVIPLTESADRWNQAFEAIDKLSGNNGTLTRDEVQKFIADREKQDAENVDKGLLTGSLDAMINLAIARKMLSKFDTVSQASGSLFGNTTISKADLQALAQEDGNTKDVTAKDLSLSSLGQLSRLRPIRLGENKLDLIDLKGFKRLEPIQIEPLR